MHVYNLWRRDARSGEHRFSLSNLKKLHLQLQENKIVSAANEAAVVEVLRVLAEMIVYGDSKSELLFDHFCEKNMLALFLEIVSAQECPSSVHIQLLQTLSILVNCVKNDTSLYYLLSNNYINDIITVYTSLTLGPEGEGVVERASLQEKEDNVLHPFASFLKSMSLRMNRQTIQFFFNAESKRFPLLATAIQLLRSGDSMVRISAQSIILNVYRVDEAAVYSFTLSDAFAGSLVSNIVATLKGQLVAMCSGGDVGNGAEARVAEQVNLIEDWLLYSTDLMGLGVEALRQRLLLGLEKDFFVPMVLDRVELIASGPVDAIADGNIELNGLLMYLITFTRCVVERSLYSAVLSQMLDPVEGRYRRAVVALLRSTHSCIARLVGLLLYNVAEYAIAATGHSSDAAEVALLLGRLLLSPCDGAVDAGCAESAVIEDVIDGLVSTSIDSKDDSSSSSSSSSDEWIVYELLAAPMTAMAAPAAQVRVYTAYAYARLAYEQRGLRGITSVGRQLRRSLAAALAARRLVGQALLQRLAGCSEASSSGGGSGREGSAVKVAEFAVACMHEEMQRLQDRAIWDSVARNMMQDPTALLPPRPEALGAYPTVNLTPAAADFDAIRRELQHFLLLHSLGDNISRLLGSLSASSGAAEAAGCDDISMRFDHKCALMPFSDVGMVNSLLYEGCAIEMKGRKFLDCYVVAGGGSGLTGGKASPFRGVGTLLGSSPTRRGAAVTPPPAPALESVVSPWRSKRNFGEMLFMQDNCNLVLVEPGEAVGFTVRAMASLLFTEHIIDQSDRKRVTFIVKTAARDAIPLMDKIGTEEALSSSSSSGGASSFRPLTLLRAQRPRGVFAVTVLFETAQAGALVASHLERRKQALVEEKRRFLEELLVS